MIKSKLIGAKMLTKVGWITIEQGQDKLYKKLGLDIFEDEIEQGNDNDKRIIKSKRKNNDKQSDLSI
jgi:hypothetical protein